MGGTRHSKDASGRPQVNAHRVRPSENLSRSSCNLEEKCTHSCVNEFSRLDATLIRSLLTNLAAEIRPTNGTTLTIVGGAYLALLGLRESTIDIDSITPLSV